MVFTNIWGLSSKKTQFLIRQKKERKKGKVILEYALFYRHWWNYSRTGSVWAQVCAHTQHKKCFQCSKWSQNLTRITQKYIDSSPYQVHQKCRPILIIWMRQIRNEQWSLCCKCGGNHPSNYKYVYFIIFLEKKSKN